MYLVELGNHHPALADLVMASAGPRFAALSNMRSPCKPEAAGFTSQEHGIHSVHNEPTRLASRHSFLSTTCPDEESLAAGISFPPNRLLHNQHVLHMDQLLEDPQRFCINESATVQLASMTNRGNCSKLVLLLPVARTWRRVLVFLLSVLLCCSVRQLKPGQLATELTALNPKPVRAETKTKHTPASTEKRKTPPSKNSALVFAVGAFLPLLRGVVVTA